MLACARCVHGLSSVSYNTKCARLVRSRPCVLPGPRYGNTAFKVTNTGGVGRRGRWCYLRQYVGYGRQTVPDTPMPALIGKGSLHGLGTSCRIPCRRCSNARSSTNGDGLRGRAPGDMSPHAYNAGVIPLCQCQPGACYLIMYHRRVGRHRHARHRALRLTLVPDVAS